jgi:hypothetical protein
MQVEFRLRQASDKISECFPHGYSVAIAMPRALRACCFGVAVPALFPEARCPNISHYGLEETFLL